MSARFFVQGAHEAGERVRLETGDAHHAVSVLRLRSGDAIEIVDSGARAYDARIEIAGSDVAAVLVAERATAPRAALAIDVAQAIPKGAKMDFVVEKTVELGVRAILPVTSERTIVRDAGSAKLARWRRVARSAAQQCGRRDVPDVAVPQTLTTLLTRFADYDLVLFAWETAAREPLRERLPSLLRGVSRVLVVVGPEGGFSHGEADAARTAGAAIVSLGTRILRTETAALAMLAILDYESEERTESLALPS